MRITRPFVLLALALLLAPRIEASRTSVWESNPPAAVFATTNETGLLASPTLADVAKVDAAEPPAFDLGDVALVESVLEHEERLGLGPLDLLGPTPLRGPPPSYLETRVRGFELLPPFRVGESPRLSLWPRQACGSFSCELASDSPEDPWGLESSGAFGAIDRRDRGITNPIAGTIDLEAVAKEAAATAVEELSCVGVANGLTSSLLGYDFVRKEEVKGPLARILAGISVVPGIPATVRRIDEIPGLKRVSRLDIPGGVASAPGKPERVYAHFDEAGSPSYYGISDDLPRRGGEHRLDDTKTGVTQKPLTGPLAHGEARTIEAKLIRERLAEARAKGLIDGTEPIEEQLRKAGLNNKNRGRTPDRWLDIDPDDFVGDHSGEAFDIRTPGPKQKR